MNLREVKRIVSVVYTILYIVCTMRGFDSKSIFWEYILGWILGRGCHYQTFSFMAVAYTRRRGEVLGQGVCQVGCGCDWASLVLLQQEYWSFETFLAWPLFTFTAFHSFSPPPSPLLLMCCLAACKAAPNMIATLKRSGIKQTLVPRCL